MGTVGRRAAFDAAARIMAGGGPAPPSLAAVAAALGCEQAEVEDLFETPEALTRELIIEFVQQSFAEAAASVAGARDGAEGLSRYLSTLVATCLERLDEFQVTYLVRQLHGGDALGISHEINTARISTTLNRSLDGLEALLAKERGPDDLAAAIHPRRLAFITLLTGLGLVLALGIGKTTARGLNHGTAELLRETSRALSGTIAALRQLAGLNEAARVMAGLRTEAELLEIVPKLLTEALGLTEARFELDGVEQEGEIPVVADGARAGALLGVLEQGDRVRVETFASMVGLALENVRLYEGLQARIEERTAQLVQAAKMTALGSLVAGIAHEVNTPIGSVLSSQATITRAIEKVRADGRVSERAERFLGIAEASCVNVGVAATRVSEIVQRLRRFSRLDESEESEVNVCELLRDTIGVLQLDLDERCRIVLDAAELPALRCYPGQLNQLFLNVLQNAVEALEGPGRIEVSARSSPWTRRATPQPPPARA